MIADSRAHAREMDAADGKIDGKFFGDKVWLSWGGRPVHWTMLDPHKLVRMRLHRMP